MGVMKQDEPILEAEVVEIDGVAVEPRMEENNPAYQRAWRFDWQSWPGKIRVLDKRWAPLWIILGIFAVILFLIISFFILVFAIFYGMMKRILRAVLLVFSGSDQTLNRRS
jgi:hypothetical protein